MPFVAPDALSSPAQAKKRATWAELLKRVFEIDVLTCPWCGGQRRLIALITDGAVVHKILAHLGLPTAAPAPAPARSPPELDFAGQAPPRRHRARTGSSMTGYPRRRPRE